MIRTVRIFIAVAAASLLVASSIHLGVLMDGYRHQEAGIAEAVIGAGILIGLALTWLSGHKGLVAGVTALAFGLLGTLVGVFTIVIGVGPATIPDVVYHIALLAWLAVGVIVASRGMPRRSKSRAGQAGGSPRSSRSAS